MANYLLAYKGGGMAATDAEREAAMAAWGNWFGTLGPAIVDAGNPFGPSAAVGGNGAVSQGAASGLTGYSVLQADSLDAASELAKGCPVLAAGGSVEVYETIPVM
jgi:YCII-related domain